MFRKGLVQHEQIRDAFANSDVGLPLLIRCATEDQFKLSVVKQRSLELLLVMTFNKQAATRIRGDEQFMAHIQTLVKSEEVGLQHVAESIIWKLNNEDQMIADKKEKTLQQESDNNAPVDKNKTEVSQKDHEYEYDIMIVSSLC